MVEPVEDKKEEKPKKVYDYEKDHKKTIKQMAAEVAESRNRPEEPVEEKKVEKEEKVVPPVEKKEEPKEKPLDVEEVAEKAATKATSKLKEELDKIQQSTKTTEEKKEATEELQSKWKKEGRNPKDYDEIYEAASQAGFEKAKEWFEAQEKLKEEALAKKTDEQKAQEAEAKVKEETDQKARNDQVLADTEKLFQAGFLKRPKDLQDESDETKEYKEFFTRAIKFNQERLTKGEQPVASIIEYAYMHDKKPSKQPAGADAPISGAKSAASGNPTESKKPYIYARDHGKSYRQIISEIKRGE